MLRCAPVTAHEPTKGTEIAALEARYNEHRVLAEGAVLGERRAALARLVMVAMFAAVTLLGGAGGRAQTLVGLVYMAYAVATLLVLRRLQGGDPRRALWRPLFLTVVDFSMITTMALLDVTGGVPFSPGQHVVASAIVMSFSVARTSLVHVAASVVLALVSYAIVGAYGGQLRSHITVFVMGGYLVLGFMIGITNRAVSRMFQGLRQRDNLTRFLPRQVAERVIAHGPNALAPIEREITVMFSDIRGFTGMSEGMGPTEVLSMLDDYFGRMSQIVKGHDGVVGKFMGDGLLAYWGVPDRLDDHAVRAVRAARDMRRAVRELNQHRAHSGLAPIRIGIGIHTGNVAAGMLGGTLQSEYTVIGDAVNVASRVEGLTKDHDVDVLVSETTWAQLPEPRRGERIASAEIRGRKEPVVLFTIDSSAATIEISAKPGV
jgi:adenylate cyclase